MSCLGEQRANCTAGISPGPACAHTQEDRACAQKAESPGGGQTPAAAPRRCTAPHAGFCGPGRPTVAFVAIVSFTPTLTTGHGHSSGGANGATARSAILQQGGGGPGKVETKATGVSQPRANPAPARHTRERTLHGQVSCKKDPTGSDGPTARAGFQFLPNNQG